MPEFETVHYAVEDGVAWLVLNRPQVLNAFNSTMQDELRTLWRGMRGDDAVRCVVLTGAGDKAFCTGVDRTETFSRPASERRFGRRSTPFHLDDPGQNIGPKSNDLWKPVVAAVNGMACGGAFYILGEVDIIIAAHHATFFDPHVTYGMTSSFESMHMLQKMPLGEVARMQLLGSHERLSAERAHQIGLVSEVVAADELRDSAARVAGAIASAPSHVAQGTLRAAWLGQELPRAQALAVGGLLARLGDNLFSYGGE